jgi:cytochrome c-type protein NapC
MSNNNSDECNGHIICRLWQLLKVPSAKYSLGILLVVGFVSGIIFWGGFNTAMEMTNNEDFCISCHEMEDNVYQEYKQTVHYSNRTGVRATCPDCHVPKEWTHKVVRKIQASNELLHKALGSINTREKFEAKRLQLANNVWKVMKKTDSRECRNCHNFDFMDFGVQGRRAVDQHSKALDEGKTCIDCHKGIAHELPDMHDVDPTAVVGEI